MITKKSLVQLVAMFGLLVPLAPGALAAAPYYPVTPIGNLGGDSGDLNDLNNRGQVVGYSLSTGSVRHAYLSDNGASRSLHPNWATASHAYSINDDSVGAGSVTSDNVTQAVTFAGTKVNLIGSLGGERANSVATAINASGQVAGTSALADPVIHRAFRYSDGVMQDLGTLGGRSSEAHAMNARGDVAGHADINGSGSHHAFLHRDCAMIDLGTLGGTFSSANAINDSGTVVGHAYLPTDSHAHAFSYANGRMSDLGSLGGANSYAMGINSHGTIVGSSEMAGDGPTHAFIFSNGSMLDLNLLVDPDLDWTLRYAADINDAGQIAVLGCASSGLMCEGFLLNPVPEPATWGMLAAGGILVALAQRRRPRLISPSAGKD